MVPTEGKSSITSATAAIRAGELTAAELMSETLERARTTEPIVHAYVEIDEEAAMAAAEEADKRQANGGPLGILHGIPVGVKDLLTTKGQPTSAGSGFPQDHYPQDDAAAVASLRRAGAIIVGKQHTHEFGFGMDEPPTRNPWDLERYAGGSTVGGGVSVAVGSCLAALGTDGGGSIRKPAAINGVVGLKPTFGKTSALGMVPGATSFDHIGWITGSVDDAALLLEATAESTPPETSLRGGGDAAGLRLGCPEYFFTDVASDIEKQIATCLEALAGLGAEVIRFELPELESALKIHGTLGAIESYRMHAASVNRFPERYHPQTLDLLRGFAHVSEADAVIARRQRSDLRQAMDEAFSRHGLDAICGPTLALPPVKMEQMDPYRLLPEYTRLTAPFNVTGQPALSVPCGLDSLGLPVGFQIAARDGEESTVLQVGRAVERTGLWTHSLPSTV